MLSGIGSFLLLYSIPYMTMPQNIYPSLYLCHRLVPALDIINSAVTSIFGCVFGAHISLEYMPTS